MVAKASRAEFQEAYLFTHGVVDGSAELELVRGAQLGLLRVAHRVMHDVVVARHVEAIVARLRRRDQRDRKRSCKWQYGTLVNEELVVDTFYRRCSQWHRKKNSCKLALTVLGVAQVVHDGLGEVDGLQAVVLEQAPRLDHLQSGVLPRVLSGTPNQ